MERAPSSPCISLCQLNEEAICKGCYRSAEEIRNWVYLDSEQRLAVLSLCAERAAIKNTSKV